MQDNTNFQKDLPIVIVLGLGVLLGSMNSTMFNMALPTMMHIFHASLPEVQWLSSAYLLAMGMSAPVMAFAANRLGSRKLFLNLTGIIAILSIVGCFSRSISTVILIRVLFGFCAGMLSPLTLAMIYSQLSPANHTKAVALWGTVSICAGLLPPSISGLLIQYFPWYSLFLFNLPFAILALLFGNKYLLKHTQDTSSVKFHMADFCFLCFGSMLILIAASNLSQWGISTPFIVSALSGIVLLGMYVFKNKNSNTALLSLQVFRYKQYIVALSLDFIIAITTYACTFGMPLYLQNGLGLSAATSGFIMMPQAVVCLIAMPLAGTLYEKYGPKKLGILAALIVFFTSLPMTALTPDTSIWLILIALTIRSSGIMMMSMMVTNLAMSSVLPALATHASAVKNWLQQVISSLVIACAGGYISMILHLESDYALSYSTGVSNLLLCSTVMSVIAILLMTCFIKTDSSK